jgi:fimbrial chaperone protein
MGSHSNIGASFSFGFSMISFISDRVTKWATVCAAVLFLALTSRAAEAQSLSVLPVNLFLQPGQSATTLTVTNLGSSETAIQIRAYAWNQADGGEDQLTASGTIVASPPLASIAAGATQVVRLILRQSPQGREATYRILLDQIPPPAEPGTVHVVLRLSIPIFAQPATRAVPHVQFHIENDAGQLYLVGTNDGLRHEAIRDIVLSTADGVELKPASGVSPYILAGATRRWALAASSSLPLPIATLQLKAHADAGVIEQQVRVVAGP